MQVSATTGFSGIADVVMVPSTGALEAGKLSVLRAGEVDDTGTMGWSSERMTPEINNSILIPIQNA